MKHLLTGLIFFGFSALGADPTPFEKYELTSEKGKKVRLTDYKGKHVLVSLLFTRCQMPKMCPLTLRLTQTVQRQWKKKKPNLPLQVVIVTIDPEHDTPKVLSAYAKDRKLDLSNLTLLTGKKELLDEFASEFNVIGIPSEVGIISHNLKSILLDPELNEIAQFKDNEWNPKDVFEALETSLKTKKPVS